MAIRRSTNRAKDSTYRRVEERAQQWQAEVTARFQEEQDRRQERSRGLARGRGHG